MKTIAMLVGAAFVALSVFSTAQAYDVSVRGYTRSNGTYVAPYHRTSPDGFCSNNYGGC